MSAKLFLALAAIVLAGCQSSVQTPSKSDVTSYNPYASPQAQAAQQHRPPGR